MKKSVIMVLLFFAVFLVSSCGQVEMKQEMPEGSLRNKKVLIACFSPSGETGKIAEEIHKETGGDMFEIRPLYPYPESSFMTAVVARQELSDNETPIMADYLSDAAGYDVIFLGYPIWWFDAPMIIRSFLKTQPLSEKIIIPFSTAYISGNEASLATIRQAAPEAKVLSGKVFYDDDDLKDMKSWLKNCGF